MKIVIVIPKHKYNISMATCACGTGFFHPGLATSWVARGAPEGAAVKESIG